MIKLITGLVLALLVAIFVVVNTVTPKEVNRVMEVHVVNEEKKTALKVLEQEQNFNWDEKTKKYKICIGELTPTTYNTTCEFEYEKIVITHFIGSQRSPQTPVCFYVDFKRNTCRIGSDFEEEYSEREITSQFPTQK